MISRIQSPQKKPCDRRQKSSFLVAKNEPRITERTVCKNYMSEIDVEGTVIKNVTDFGAFIDLGGVDGLLHISEMSWGQS